uniref:Ribosomal protein L9, N-terminal domain containing protein, putative n=1 Tax=Theileria annulata TaxID=5874 RepID=A0A3B0MQ86_THEAN
MINNINIANNFNYLLLIKRNKILCTRGTISRRTWYPRVDSKKISVVLLKDSEGLGKSGEIVATSRGFANYHLFPNGIAAYANWYNIDLYCTKDPDHTTHSTKRDVITAEFSSKDVKPEYILFSSRFRKFDVNFDVRTFASDTTRLCSPISIYQILDEFSNKYTIDVIPSQIKEIRCKDTGSVIDLFDSFEYLSFSTVGTFEITIKFPLTDDPDNSIIFTLSIKSLDYS